MLHNIVYFINSLDYNLDELLPKSYVNNLTKDLVFCCLLKQFSQFYINPILLVYLSIHPFNIYTLQQNILCVRKRALNME